MSVNCTACANCSQLVSDRDLSKIQCDGCKCLIHVRCTDIVQEDRVTRQRLSVEIVCNSCGMSLDSFKDIKSLIQSLKDDMCNELVKLKEKFNDINNKLAVVYKLNSEQFSDGIVQEARDRVGVPRCIR